VKATIRSVKKEMDLIQSILDKAKIPLVADIISEKKDEL